jgi:PKD repeat protein
MNVNPTDSVIWNFGDNSALVINNNNPVHAYANSGTYNVCLTIKRTYPGTTLAPCVRTACLTLIIPPVNNSCDYVPRFIFRTDAAVAGKLIFTKTTFTTASTNATAKWNFGDGTSSLLWNAEHTYTQTGVYVVCLTVNYGNTCSKSICDTISVVVNPISCAEARVSFYYRKDSYLPNKFYFFATSSTPAISQQWSFKRIGDTSAAAITNQINPVWIFADTGRYQVCLRVVLTTGCVKEYCSMVYVQRNSVPSQCYLQAYPNPATNEVMVNVQLSQPQFINAYVYNSQNTLVANRIMQGFTGNNVISINISNLPPGLYIVRVIYGNSLCFSRFQKL